MCALMKWLFLCLLATSLGVILREPSNVDNNTERVVLILEMGFFFSSFDFF